MKTKLEKTLFVCMLIWFIVAMFACRRCYQMKKEINWWKSLTPLYIEP